MTLTELCEPFFLHVGEILRAGANGERNAALVRARLWQRLEELHATAKGDAHSLAAEYAKVEPVLAFFADDVINASTLPFARQWEGPMLLASEQRISVANGRARFFTDLDVAFRDRANERLAIFQTCLGLGFGGVHRQTPDVLKEKSEQIARQLAPAGKRGESGRICGEAYDHIQTDVLFEPIREKVLAIGIIAAALLLMTLVAYAWIQFDARQDINATLNTITTNTTVTAQAPRV